MGRAVFHKFPLDSTFNGKRVLNMGCGTAKFKHAVNVDAYAECKPDVVWDMESKEPYPFKDEEFDLVIFNHVLEHVHNWWHNFEEGCRVLKPGGTLVVYVPASGNDSQLGYRDHVNVINLYSFFGTGDTNPGTNAWAEHNKVSPANAVRLAAVDTVFYNKWWLKYGPKCWRTWCAEHLRNIMDEKGYFFIKGRK